MHLSKRLQAVADFVTPGNRVADIGCDHAHTSIYLMEKKIAPFIVAMDVNQGPIDHAKENIKHYKFQDRIDTRKSDGMEKLNIGEVDTILIAGMGGALTVQILSARMDIVNSVRELVLQPQSDLHRVRKMIQDSGFLIIQETMIREFGKIYVMMKAWPKQEVKKQEDFVLETGAHFYYGRLLLEQANPILYKFILRDKRLNEAIEENLNSEITENTVARHKVITKKLNIIQDGLNYYK
ncbi:MAG: class I SAM-dependent methyltransferase [Mobilitalea sp.]